MKIKLQNFMGKNVKRLSTYYRETATQLKIRLCEFVECFDQNDWKRAKMSTKPKIIIIIKSSQVA